MHYETETGITITLMHDEVHEQPFLVLRNVPGLPGNHTYTAAAFLDTAAAERGFVVGADWPDQLPFHIEAHEVLEIAQLVRSSTDRKRGYFEMKWVALQPSDPF